MKTGSVSPIAQSALDAMRSLAPSDDLRMHVTRSIWYCVGAAIGMIATVGFMILGPELVPPASVFVVFLLVCFGLVFLVSAVAAVAPLSGVLVQEKLRLLDSRLEFQKIEDEMTELEGRIAIATRLMRSAEGELKSASAKNAVVVALKILDIEGRFTMDHLEISLKPIAKRMARDDKNVADALRKAGVLTAEG